MIFSLFRFLSFDHKIPPAWNTLLLYLPCCTWSLSARLCLTFCDPMDCNPPGSLSMWILQARILEWVVMPFSRGSSQPRDWTQVSHTAGGFFTIWVTKEAYSSLFTNSILAFKNKFKSHSSGKSLQVFSCYPTSKKKKKWRRRRKTILT